MAATPAPAGRCLVAPRLLILTGIGLAGLLVAYGIWRWPTTLTAATDSAPDRRVRCRGWPPTRRWRIMCAAA